MYLEDEIVGSCERVVGMKKLIEASGSFKEKISSDKHWEKVNRHYRV